MSKIKLMAILLFVLQSFSFAYSEQEISEALKRQAKLAKIDEKVLYTIAKIESGFKPYLISFVSEHQNYIFKNLQINIKKYGDRYIVSLSGSKENIIKTAKMLFKDEFSIDVGLMQINSQNFKADEIEKMFELDYNIEKATTILKLCNDKYSEIARIIECYNKGYTKVSQFSYFNRFKKSFLKDFAGVKL